VTILQAGLRPKPKDRFFFWGAKKAAYTALLACQAPSAAIPQSLAYLKNLLTSHL